MVKMKSFIKKFPFIKIIRKVRQKFEYRRLMKYNNAYKKRIEPLLKVNDLSSYLEKKEANLTQKYYIIGMQHDKMGIFGYINNFMPHIIYAILNGYIPIIDMKNYPNIYQRENENSWESFFEQPLHIGLENITGNSIIHAPDDLWYRWAPNSCPLMSDKEIYLWGEIYHRYVRYNDSTQRYINKEVSTILKDPEKTIGVIYRGTDYTQGQPKGHPIQPSMRMLSDRVKEMMDKYQCKYIYLASDEKKIVDYMNNRFPGAVLINQRVYYDEATNVDYSNYNVDHIGISGAHFDRDNNEYLIGIEYISTISLVARCHYLVAGACGGTTAALYLNNLKYKDKYIFNLGKYGIDPVPET